MNHYVLNRLENVYEINRHVYNFEYESLKYDLNEFLDTIDRNKLMRTIFRNYAVNLRAKESCDSAIYCYLGDITLLYQKNRQNIISNLSDNVVDHTISKIYSIMATILYIIESYEINNMN